MVVVGPGSHSSWEGVVQDSMIVKTRAARWLVDMEEGDAQDGDDSDGDVAHAQRRIAEVQAEVAWRRGRADERAGSSWIRVLGCGCDDSGETDGRGAYCGEYEGERDDCAALTCWGGGAGDGA